MMFRCFVLLSTVAFLGQVGCDKKSATSKSLPKATATAATSTTTPVGKASVSAVPSEANSDKAQASATPPSVTAEPVDTKPVAGATPKSEGDVQSAKTPPEEKTPSTGGAETSPTSVKGFVDLLTAALEETGSCERRDGSVAPKNINGCLKEIYAIKKASWTPPKEFFPDWNAKKALRDALGKVYVQALDHKNQTVVYSALRAGWSSLDNSDATYKKLEKMLQGADAELAEQAAYARFSRKVKDDTPTLELAKSVLKAHKHERVRLQGCRYIGSKVFEGSSDHFKLLSGYGNDKKEAKAVRACAVSQLGVIGSERDISKIVRFMKEKDLQYAVVYALGRGIRTKNAYDAYLNYFLKQAPKGDLSSSPFTIFIPGKQDLDKFDSKKAVKVLALALKAPGELKYWIPALLGKLDAKKELEEGLKSLGETAGDWNKETLKKEFEKALKRLAASPKK